MLCLFFSLFVMMSSIGIVMSWWGGISCFFFLIPLYMICSGVSEVDYGFLMEGCLNFPLIILCFWIGGNALASCFVHYYNKVWYFKSTLILMNFLILSFSVSNGIFFFIFFEACLGPISFLVLFWGHTPERVEAALYMMIYTILGGGMHMVGLVLIDLCFGSNSFFFESNLSFFYNDSVVLSFWLFFIVIPFFIKAPCYGVHQWLPKAHVEAPVLGSMLLAAVMLKLGLYGLVRYMMMFNMSLLFVMFIQVMGIVGGVLSGIVAVRQVDIKSIIAYSSVSHMSWGLACLFCLSESSIQGAYFLMVSHGLSSSGLFAWAGYVFSKSGSRNLFILSGFRWLSVFQSIVILLLLMANMGMPPLLSFWAEFFVFFSLLYFFPWVVFFGFVSIMLGGCYCFFLYVISQADNVWYKKSGDMFLMLMEGNEMLVIFVGHCVPLFILFFSPGFILVL